MSSLRTWQRPWLGARWPRSVRIRRRGDFLAVQRGPRKASGEFLVVVQRASSTLRFGLVVSRKVGNAVVRNRVKRWLREALRRQVAAWPTADHAVIARPRAATAGFQVLETELAAASQRLGRASRGGAPI